ncbi:hypothetical protein OSB04_015148 [Centaurea solstitialis]|uniref:Protein kinase domain-containing protein n=1 Tax=Centaurea solstitialis TaxID=347529 RepID=A0AA38T698_9ASTR|nr:hypothetical protein OSB04_015148 [Centaurea solstitialis]
MSSSMDDGKESETSSSSSSPSSSLQGSQPCRHFEFIEILLATHEFDESLVIGHGGFGNVYRGEVNNGSSLVVAAIKRLDSMSSQGATEFWAEVEMLSKLRHCNLVSLFGYCNYGKEKILVYEYMPNGTLEDHLHKFGTPLTWLRRLNICLGAARGLHYIHTGTEIKVIHRDVKSSNILLDESWEAKISDFGLSKMSPTNQPSTYVNTAVRGTFGYLDPDYYTTGKLTKKSDVYAFGVVLLEVLCRKRAVDRILDEEQWVNLAIWAQQSIKQGNLKHIIDYDIRSQISPKCLKEFVRIIKGCLHNNSKQRSTIAEVVVSLESILSLQEKYNTSLQVGGKTMFGRMVDMIPFSSNRENSDFETKELKITLTVKEMCAGDFGPVFRSQGADVKVLLGTRELPADYKLQLLIEFKFADLKRATNNFSPHMRLNPRYKEIFLGWVDKDTFAPSTEGVGISVAVQRFNQSSHEIPAEWQVEVSMLGRLIHPNIIRLLGYCNDKKHEVLLVHEYMQNQSLDSHLYPAEAPANAIVGVPLLSWGTRLGIMIGVAQGLTYLHLSDVVHLEVKPSSIYLDQDFNAKLGNFLVARSCLEERTKLVGMIRYLDPHYLQTVDFIFYLDLNATAYAFSAFFPSADRQVSVKTDIYSFGVVLLEILTGLKPWVLLEIVAEEQQSLANMARHILANEGELKKLIDPRLDQNYPRKGAFECVELAFRCLATEPKDRPSSDEVLRSQGDSSKYPADYEIQSVKQFKFADLERATNNFSQDLLLAEGGYGKVFLGWVNQNTFAPSTRGDGLAVAVKRFHQGNERWAVEVSLLGRRIHPNIIRLLGCCNDRKNEWLLVYEYMQNQSFDRFLFPAASGNVKPLSWGTRLSIMIGVAQGLTYLHLSDVVHRDVKPSSIYLDQDFNAKLGNFGLARSCAVQTVMNGTIGYLDPEYFRTGIVSVQSDIYSFGVVLLETLTGLKAWDWSRPTGQWDLARWAIPILAEKGEVPKIIDPHLGQNYPEEGAFRCAALALRCLALHATDRPSSDEVLQCLKQIYADT